MKARVNELELLIVKLPAPADPARPTRDPLPQTIRQLRPSQLAGIIADYQAGATVLALANKYGFNRNTIPTILKRAGVRLRGSGLTDEQIDEAVRLYEAGQSLARIGNRFGVDAHTVRRRLLDRGVAMRSRR